MEARKTDNTKRRVNPTCTLQDPLQHQHRFNTSEVYCMHGSCGSHPYEDHTRLEPLK